MHQEDEHSHHRPLSGESAHRSRRRADPDTTVEVDSSAFFSETPGGDPEPKARKDIERAPRLETPPPLKPPKPPRHPAPPEREPEPEEEPEENGMPKRGVFMLFLQAVLSIAALVQLWRTQMLPAKYLIILAVLLFLFWLVVRYCQRYRASGIVARIFSLALCAVMAVGCVWAQQGLSALGNITSGLLTGSAANQITKEPFVIYLSGVDTRGELTTSARSDVNILAVVNPTTKRVALINTPRDYYVDLAGTSSKDKLTHAGLYGVETSMATLGQLYGISVDHYIRINFAGFISIVDAIGGVDVYSDYAFTSVGSPGYYDPTTFVEGWNHLDGKAALAFARERHAFASGDVQRGINQMKVIDAMLNKIKSPTILMSFSKLMDAVSDCFVTSLSSEQISALVRMQLNDLAEWDIQSYSVTGTSSTSTKCFSAQGQKLYVMLPDQNTVNEACALIQSVLSGEASASSASSTAAEEENAYSATGDPNAETSSLDETPAEPEIDVPAETPQPTEEPAAVETTPEPEAVAPAATPAPTPAPTSTPASRPASSHEQSSSSQSTASSSQSTAASESTSIELPSQSEVEQAASSIADTLTQIFGALADAASSSTDDAA